MQLKKIGAFLCALFTAFVLVGTVETAVTGPAVTYAAKGGSFRSTPRVSRPAAPKPAAPKTNNHASAKPSTGTTRPSTTAPRTNRPSGLGNVLRGIGIFAGGMMLGNLLSGMLGMNTMGGMSTIFGILFNILLYGAIIKIVMWAISRFFGRRADGDPYHNNRMSYANMNDTNEQMSDRGDDEVPDIRPPRRDTGGANYDPKRTADWYRRH